MSTTETQTPQLGLRRISWLDLNIVFYFSGPEVDFAHFDMNRLDHMPINWLLQLAGLQTLDFSDSPKIIDI